MGKLYYGNSDGLSNYPTLIRFFDQNGINRNAVKVYWGNSSGASVLVWPQDTTPPFQLDYVDARVAYSEHYKDPEFTGDNHSVKKYIYYILRTNSAVPEQYLKNEIKFGGQVGTTNTLDASLIEFASGNLWPSEPDGYYHHYWRIDYEQLNNRYSLHSSGIHKGIKIWFKTSSITWRACQVYFFPEINYYSTFTMVKSMSFSQTKYDEYHNYVYPLQVEVELTVTPQQMRDEGIQINMVVDTFAHGRDFLESPFNIEKIQDGLDGDATKDAVFKYKISPKDASNPYTGKCDICVTAYDNVDQTFNHRYIKIYHTNFYDPSNMSDENLYRYP